MPYWRTLSAEIGRRWGGRARLVRRDDDLCFVVQLRTAVWLDIPPHLAWPGYPWFDALEWRDPHTGERLAPNSGIIETLLRADIMRGEQDETRAHRNYRRRVIDTRNRLRNAMVKTAVSAIDLHAVRRSIIARTERPAPWDKHRTDRVAAEVTL